MPQRRNEKSIEAERRYRAGEKLVDIANALDVPESTVRRWKSTQVWSGQKKQSERSDSKANAKPNARIQDKGNDTLKGALEIDNNPVMPKTNTPSPFARFGNQNAAGNKGGLGAPRYNKYAVKTHEHVTVFFTADVIDDTERAMIQSDYDKYILQYVLLDTLNIREKRILQDIKKLRDNPDGMVFDSVTTDKGELTTTFTNRNKSGEEYDGNSSTQTTGNTSHIAVPTQKRIMELEEALTRVQSRKQRAIETLHKMEMDDYKVTMDFAKLEMYRQKLAGVYDLDELLDGDDVLEDFGD